MFAKTVTLLYYSHLGDYLNYYNEIKKELINNEINRNVKNYSINRSDLNTYYNVGKMLSEAGKHYGEGIIKNYSIKLINEVNKKYNTTNLKRMRQFYWMIEKGATMSHQLSWSHYIEMLPIKNTEKINYYIEITISQNLGIRKLRKRIKSQEYERLPIDTKNKLSNKENINIEDLIKNPIFLKSRESFKDISEKALKRIILEDIESFMKELGNSFSFIGSEYKIKLGSNYNYIDLLLFNYEYNCFVVVELKVTELKKEHIGQIEVYMNYIDNNLKNINHDKTIGIIICKKNNKYVIEYCSDKRVISREYKIIKNKEWGLDELL